MSLAQLLTVAIRTAARRGWRRADTSSATMWNSFCAENPLEGHIGMTFREVRVCDPGCPALQLFNLVPRAFQALSAELAGIKPVDQD